MKIRLTDLKDRPCDRYYYYIKKHYGKNEFDPMEVFDVLKPSAEDVSWLICNTEICQTEEWFKYYKSLKPDTSDVTCLIEKVELCQTEEWFKYYKSLKPNASDVTWLKDNCEKFREYEDKNENKI